MKKQLNFVSIINAVFMIFLTSIISCSSNKQQDPRRTLLDADKTVFKEQKYSGNKELSESLGALFIEYGNSELDPGNWHVFTRIKDDNILVMVQIKKLKGTEKESRLILADMTEKYITADHKLKNKKLYIAIMGQVFWGALKTPVYQSEAFPVKESELLNFYGPAPKMVTKK